MCLLSLHNPLKASQYSPMPVHQPANLLYVSLSDLAVQPTSSATFASALYVRSASSPSAGTDARSDRLPPHTRKKSRHLTQ